MKRKISLIRFFLLMSFALFLNFKVFGNEVLAPCEFWCGVKKDFLSPVTTSARLPLLIGSTLTVGLVATQDEIDEPLARDLAREKPLGHTSSWGDTAGQLVPNAIYVGGMAFYAWKWQNPEAYQNAILMTKATAYSSLVTTIFKYTFGEPRPDGSDHRSFPSGHSTTAFAFASVVQQIHGWRAGIPSYLLAGFVGFSRMNDGKHYLRDVIAGATIGMAYGIGVTELYENTKRDSSTAQVLLVPTDDLSGPQIQVILFN